MEVCCEGIGASSAWLGHQESPPRGLSLRTLRTERAWQLANSRDVMRLVLDRYP